MYTDEYFMRLALKEAMQAFEEEEIPVGAVVVQNNKVLARGYNMTEKLNDTTAHAEMIALTSAFNYMGAKYLPEATLYVTVEPCVMCAGALYWSKIKRVVWGAPDLKNGHRRFFSPLPSQELKEEVISPFHPKTEITTGILAEECSALMREFFKNKR